MLVLSDLHFGDSRCSLHSMKTVRALVEKLQPYSPLEEIILLGDILDLQLANWAKSIEGVFAGGPKKRTVGFRYFLRFLVEQTKAKRVTYVPGNHDYKLFDYHAIEHALIRPLRSGKKLSGRIAFFRKFSPSFLQGILTGLPAEFNLVYPHYTLRAGRERIILTHGHYFDPTQAFAHEIAKVFTDPVAKEEIPRLRNQFFRRASFYQNMMSGLSIQPKLRDIFNTIYQPVITFKETLRRHTRKSFLTPAMKRSIEFYIAFCCRGKIAGLIFGHTHHPGKTEFRDSNVRYVWNAGTFLRESKESGAGSFITVCLSAKSLQNAVTVHLLK